MLDRYKKKGGFHQLIQLLETSPTTKREQFLSLIGSENPVWEDALRRRVLTISRVYGWEGQYLAEIFSRVQPLTLSNALHGSPPEQIEQLLNCLPPISKRKITDMMEDSNPSAAEKSSCVVRLLSDVRGFISQGIIRLDKVDPDLTIPENIEELLNVTSIETLSIAPDGSAAKADGKPNIVGEATEPASVGPADVDFLRRKLNHLSAEVNALKHENTVLKEKLAQIKRIA